MTNMGKTMMNTYPMSMGSSIHSKIQDKLHGDQIITHDMSGIHDSTKLGADGSIESITTITGGIGLSATKALFTSVAVITAAYLY